uniref:Uncharacterized protein n=1 Tax=Haemonchus contortus TaxID=6289 RepID=A0A7I4XZV9_HAECO
MNRKAEEAADSLAVKRTAFANIASIPLGESACLHLELSALRLRESESEDESGQCSASKRFFRWVNEDADKNGRTSAMRRYVKVTAAARQRPRQNCAGSRLAKGTLSLKRDPTSFPTTCTPAQITEVVSVR